MGTDGLFDNVYDFDMVPCLSKPTPTEQATCIGEIAYAKSKDKAYESPFAVGAKKARQWYQGGKEDDITVVVANVV